MTEKPNYYAIIPAHVRYADITPNAKLLYAEITSFLQMNGVCFATNRYFSKLYGKNKVTISRWIKELRDGGFIKVTFTYKEGTKEIDNRYIEICHDGISKIERKVLTKMLKNNNTSNNTTSNNITIKEKFISEVMSFDYPKSMLEDFINYWTEGKKKMRFQKQSTFEIKLRLLRWAKNENKWNKTKPTMSKLDSQINAWQEAKKLI